MAHNHNVKEYWSQNIGKWGKYYLEISHSDENFNVPKLLDNLYRLIIMPIEKRLMTQRYNLTLEFIKNYVKPGYVVADIGCGTGIFVVEMLKRGAFVIAIDYVQNALDLTRLMVETAVPEHKERVSYLLLDITEAPPPKSDVVLAMGITPYVSDIDTFYQNILPTTNTMYCLILDPWHWANIIRKIFPILNVRKLNWFSKSTVDAIYKRHHWVLVSRKSFGSGYLDLAIRGNQ